MGEYDKRLSAALSGNFDDLKALEEPFARQAGLDPAVMAARKAETRAKYGRPLTTNDDDLRKSRKAKATDEPIVDEADALAFVAAVEDLAKIRGKVRTARKRP